ncbi:MAG: rod shape-determining protein MreC [Formosimonas sp.]
MKTDYKLFRRTTPVWVRLFVSSACALGLMLADGSAGRLQPVRTVVSSVLSPVYTALHQASQWFSDVLVHSYSLQKLALDNQTLKEKEASNEARLTQLAQLERDNAALRAQLDLSVNQKTPSMAAQVLYQVVDPYARKLVLNKGSQNGVVSGQPVITADGLLGQITSVTPLNSEVTLVLDNKINVPVYIERDPAVRGFLSGKKEEGFLEVRFFSAQVALQTDDVLVTSGLDGLYPEGLKVGRVSKIEQADSSGQSEITVVPTTQGMAVRYVSILQIPDSKTAKSRADEQAKAVRGDQLPVTLGARTREQTRAKESK